MRLCFVYIHECYPVYICLLCIGKSSGSEYDSDGVPLWRKAQAAERRSRGSGGGDNSSSGEVEYGEGRSGDDCVRDELDRLLGRNRRNT